MRYIGNTNRQQLLSKPADCISDWIRDDPQVVSIVPEWLREFVADVPAPEADVPEHASLSSRNCCR